jgi:hypothetical protein
VAGSRGRGLSISRRGQLLPAQARLIVVTPLV